MILPGAAPVEPVRTRTTVVTIPAHRIKDWDSFHDVFAEVMGFPSYYGRNMDAWIDCMSSLDDANDGMSSITVAPGQVLTLRIDDAARLSEQRREQFKALIECVAFVNYRRIEAGELPVLSLMLGGWFGR